MIRKLLFSALAYFAVNSLSAQITITSADIAGIGKVVKQATDTMPTITAGPSGANVTWNFTALQQHVLDTLTFTNPYWTPYQSSFPSANLAILQGLNGYKGTIYTNLSVSTFNVIGQHAALGNTQVNVNMNPAEVLIPFPSTYNSTFGGTSGFDFRIAYSMFPIDSVRVKEVKTKSDKVNAWGTITTPLLSNQPCIRYRSFEHTIDTIWAHSPFQTPQWQPLQVTDDSLVRFSWWANGIGFPLVQLDSNFAPTTPTYANAQWLMATPTNSGISEYANVMSLDAYPNPASSLLSFDLSAIDASTINICDVTGREVRSVPAGLPLVTIDVAELPNGSYLYNVLNKEGVITGRGKFIIAK